MIICRTPFRISFFGGGTDYPGWFRQHGGAVLSTSIDKYCYITARYLPPFHEHRYRVVYSRIENVLTIDEIQHPAVRAILKTMNFTRGVEIHHDGDLPARSGMGSSSAFSVGLLNALYALGGRMVDKRRLAAETIHLEQDIIGETVGSQDQIATAMGGFNHIEFCSDGDFVVSPVTIGRERIEELNNHLMLFYTGIKRTAETVARSYVEDISRKEKQLHAMRGMVGQALELLNTRDCVHGFGELMHEAWLLKRELSAAVSNPAVDGMYAAARAAGALGGKLTGAGGGGFLLLLVPEERQAAVRARLSGLLHVPFRFDVSGSSIIFCDYQRDYSLCEQERFRQDVDSFRELADVAPAAPDRKG